MGDLLCLCNEREGEGERGGRQLLHLSTLQDPPFIFSAIRAGAIN